MARGRALRQRRRIPGAGLGSWLSPPIRAWAEQVLVVAEDTR
jgi:hypothetical protein